MTERRRRAVRYDAGEAIGQAEGAPSPYSREAHEIADAPDAPVMAYGEGSAAPEEAPLPENAAEQFSIAADAPIPEPRDVLATNTGVRLACTMAAMIGLFAIFLCWAEQESRVIRRFSVQSAFMTALHAVLGAGVLLLHLLLGGIPYVGVVVTLMCLLGYIAVLMLLIVERVRLMRCAWQGVRFMLPAPVERMIARYY